MGTNLMSLAQSGGKFLKLFGDRKMVRTLPYLRRVAYLESHGTEWILLPVNASSETEVVCNAQFTVKPDSTKNFAIFGGGDGNMLNEILLCNHVDYLLYRCGNFQNINVTESLFDFTIKHRYEWRFNFLKIDDVEYSPTESDQFYSTRNKFSIFTTIRSDKPWVPSYLRVFDFVLKCPSYEFDLIPVLDLSGRPAMYDEVSGQFFYNQGTGEFTWGELDSQTT